MFQRIVGVAGCIVLMVILSGCPAQSGGLHYNPTTGDIGVEVVFKDGRWVKQPRAIVAVGMGETRAVNPCVPETRAVVDPCVTSRAVSSGGAVTYVQRGTVSDSSFRAVINGESSKGLRSLSGGPLVSQKSLARQMARNAKEIREEEKETYRALKEVHEAEIKRLDKIKHAYDPSMKGQVRRFFGGGDATPDKEKSVIIVPAN